MKRVLLLQNDISSYNVPTYNQMSRSVSLTVGYYNKDKSHIDCSFDKLKLDSRLFGPFRFIKNISKICQGYDVVIFIPDLHVPSYCIIPYIVNCKKISWSIGFRVSYVHPFVTGRKHGILDWLFKLILCKCDANIFYMNKSKEFWKKTNLRMDNVFEAINTTEVRKIELRPELKKDFLFVGTLYKGKGLNLLLNAFNEISQIAKSDTKLRIVGAGSERESLEKYVKDTNLEEKVIFHGAIYDESELSKIFQHSLLCFSPSQAGLSVPKSMGYGVPFVTRKDAITGGEICHITPCVNGLLYSDDSELSSIMLDALQNRDKYILMGKKAMDYYYNNATIAHMAHGAIEAIRYVTSDNTI